MKAMLLLCLCSLLEVNVALEFVGGNSVADLNDVLAWSYSFVQPNVNIDFEITTSTNVRELVKHDAIDLGFSGAGFNDSEYAAQPDLVSLPFAAFMIAPVFNLPELNSTDVLILSLPILAGILSGNITVWNDVGIANINPRVASKLPNRNITAVVQSAGAGANHLLTDALSSASPLWAAEVGVTESPRWPDRNSNLVVGGDSYDSLATVLTTEYSLTYAVMQDILLVDATYSHMLNHAGFEVEPTLAALESTTLELGGEFGARFQVSLANPRSVSAWPIAGYEYIVLHRKSTRSCQSRRQMVDFINWLYLDEVAETVKNDADFLGVPKTFVNDLLNVFDTTLTCGPSQSALIDERTVYATIEGPELMQEFFAFFHTGYATVSTSVVFDFFEVNELKAISNTIEGENSFSVITHASQLSSQINAVRAFNPAQPTAMATIPFLLAPMRPYHSLSINGSDLILNGLVLAKIYLGQITDWNDLQLRDLNPDLIRLGLMPSGPITVITVDPYLGNELNRILVNLFAQSLSKTDSDIMAIVGPNYVWPAPHQLVVDTENQIEASVTQETNALALSLARDPQARAQVALMVNYAQQVVAPSRQTEQACLNGVDYSDLNSVAVFTNPDPNCWPLTFVESVIIQEHVYGKDCGNAVSQSVKFLEWLNHLFEPSHLTEYTPLPSSMTQDVYDALDAITCDSVSISAPTLLTVSTDTALALNTLTGVGVGLGVLFLVLVFGFRDSREIRRSSKNMLFVILLGCLILFAFPALRIADATRETCTLQLLCVAYGYSLALGSVFAKTYRVARIFSNKSFNIVSISDSTLLTAVLVLVGIDTVIIIPWQMQFQPGSSVSPYNPDDLRRTQRTTCGAGQDDTPYFITMLIFKVLILVCGTWITFRAKQIHTDFNERSYVLAMVYNVLATILLVVPLVLTTATDDDLDLIVSLGVFWATLGVLLVLFLPKLWRLSCGRWSIWGSIFTFSDLSFLTKLENMNLAEEGNLKLYIQQFSLKLKQATEGAKQDQGLGLAGMHFEEKPKFHVTRPDSQPDDATNSVTKASIGSPPPRSAAPSVNVQGKRIITANDYDLKQYITLLEARIAQLEEVHDSDHLMSQVKKEVNRKQAEIEMSSRDVNKKNSKEKDSKDSKKDSKGDSVNEKPKVGEHKRDSKPTSPAQHHQPKQGSLRSHHTATSSVSGSAAMSPTGPPESGLLISQISATGEDGGHMPLSFINVANHLDIDVNTPSLPPQMERPGDEDSEDVARVQQNSNPNTTSSTVTVVIAGEKVTHDTTLASTTSTATATTTEPTTAETASYMSLTSPPIDVSHPSSLSLTVSALSTAPESVTAFARDGAVSPVTPPSPKPIVAATLSPLKSKPNSSPNSSAPSSPKAAVSSSTHPVANIYSASSAESPRVDLSSPPFSPSINADSISHAVTHPNQN